MGRQYNYRLDYNKKDMKYLFSDRTRIKEELKGKYVYLFLDYDGTLAPIMETPDKAFMPKETRNLLRCLSEMPNYKLAIISGRALNDIKKKVGLKNNIVYVGNHGFEIDGPKIKFKSPVPYKHKGNLEKIKAKLKKSFSSVKGVLIEDKGFSLSVHYRQAEKKDISKIKTEFYAALVAYEVRNEMKVRTGKKVLEIRPPLAWDKGKAVLWLLARHKFLLRKKKQKILPIYVGDDVTDEDAFGALRRRGWTVRVGKLQKSKAFYYVKKTEEVNDLLRLLLQG
jgi:trehalose-phosphatase